MAALTGGGSGDHHHTHTEGAVRKHNLERGYAEGGRSGTIERDGEMVVVATSSSIGLERDGGGRDKNCAATPFGHDRP